MPKVSTQVYMLDHKIWKLFRPRENGRKRTKCDQFFCPTSDFFDFCTPCFFYHTFTNDADFVYKAYAEICEHSCLHCNFARLKNKHIGVLGTNVATISWLHWSPVSGYKVRILEHNFEQFSCIQKQKIYDEIFGWFVYTAVQLALLALYWEAVQWPLALAWFVLNLFTRDRTSSRARPASFSWS